MSFMRAAARARTAVRGARRYATAPGEKAKDANWSLYLAGAGVVGLAGYLYLDSGAKQAVVKEVKKVQEKSPLDPKEFKEFKLKRVEPYNWNTAKYIFELPENEASLLPVASCVVVKGPDSLTDKNGKPVIRPYTPTSPSEKEGELEFIIKRYETGLMSKHIHELKPGETLAIKGPIPKIPYKANEYEHIGMVAGGSGITPMLQILQHALADPANKTKFTLLFGNVEERDILLREDFDALKKKYPDTFEIVHVLEKAPNAKWDQPTGYIGADLIKKYFPPPSDKVKVLVCGPPPQVASVAGKKDGMKQGQLSGILKELGYTEEQVFKF